MMCKTVVYIITGISLLFPACKAVDIPSGSITGEVILCDRGLEGVTITLCNERIGAITTTTDSEGHYEFQDVWEEDYTVIPSKKGYIFEAASRKAAVSGGRESVVDDFWAIVTWQATYDYSSVEHIAAVAPTSDCGFILVGSERVENGSSETQMNVCVLKLNPLGEVLWHKSLGGSGADQGMAVIETGNQTYLVAATTESKGNGKEDAWLIELDREGSVLMDRTYGGAGNDRVSSLMETDDGHYLLAGGTEAVSADGVALGFGLMDIWILKLDRDGANVLNSGATFPGIFYGEATWDLAYGVCTANNETNRYLAAGFSDLYSENNDEGLRSRKIWIGSFDNAGCNIWNNYHEIYDNAEALDLVPTSDGYLVTGYTEDTSLDISYGWYARLNNEYEYQWDESLPGRSYRYGTSRVNRFEAGMELSGGGYLLGGYTFDESSYSHDMLLVKLDEAGNILWEKLYGGVCAGNDELHAIRETYDEGIVLVGSTWSYAGGQDLWVMRLDRNGDLHGTLEDYTGDYHAEQE